MKKALKIFSLIAATIIIIIIYMSYIDTNNEDYINNLSTKIKKELKLNEDITYTNQYGNYYIVKTTSNVIVLTKDYKEILKENISKLDINNNYDLIYKTNKLLYEKTTVKKDKLTYEYYDAFSGELIKKTTMEK